MKLRYKILILNLLVLIAAWILIKILGQDYSDNFQAENIFNKILSVIGYVYAIFLIFSAFIFCISVLGTIIFGLIKKKEWFLGFLYGLILNLILGLTIYLTQY